MIDEDERFTFLPYAYSLPEVMPQPFFISTNEVLDLSYKNHYQDRWIIALVMVMPKLLP